MSNEEKVALIKHLHCVISTLERLGDYITSFGKLQLEAYKLALAALTAPQPEPVAYFVRWPHEPAGTGTKIDAKHKDTFPFHGVVFEPLYLSPPAPVMQLVKLPGYVDDLHGIGPVMSADAVVEAIRAAGGTVEGE